jgi:hypothetical protein
MNKELILITLLFFLNYSSLAHGMTFKMCQKVSSELNKKTPMQINQDTYLNNTNCTSENKKPTLNYYNITEFTYIDIKSSNKMQKNIWCSNRAQKKLLKEVDVKYHYYTEKGDFLGMTFLNYSMCR